MIVVKTALDNWCSATTVTDTERECFGRDEWPNATHFSIKEGILVVEQMKQPAQMRTFTASQPVFKPIAVYAKGFWVSAHFVSDRMGQTEA